MVIRICGTSQSNNIKHTVLVSICFGVIPYFEEEKKTKSYKTGNVLFLM